MIKILIVFLVIAIGLFVGPMLAGHQGLAYFQAFGYRVKMSFNTFLIIEFILLLLVYIIYWLTKKTTHSKTYLWRLLFKSPLKTARQIEKAQLFILEGDYKKAAKLLAKNAKSAPNSTLTYLQAAQAHISNNELVEARKQLNEAAAICKPHEQFAFKLVQLRLQIQNKEYALARTAVTQLLDQKPRNPEVLRQAYQLYYATKDYQAIIDLLPTMYKAEVFEESQLDQFKSVAYISRMKQIAENDGVEVLIKWWNSQPKTIKTNTTFENTLKFYREKIQL